MIKEATTNDSDSIDADMYTRAAGAAVAAGAADSSTPVGAS